MSSIVLQDSLKIEVKIKSLSVNIKQKYDYNDGDSKENKIDLVFIKL